ncbi:unnamed protein product [Protopolystoma xenopodis]|uniref:Uncharacterized protein n=1 Tax=Protopolystoma xenopodis TaxID=117903 RepID=A0A3S5ARG1_9PLAT|nr:unnamed protein product [Protopolystoma xenopodis]
MVTAPFSPRQTKLSDPDREPLISAAWQPKLASTVVLAPDEELHRRLVWRYCTRRSKQAIAAYQRLCMAGYRRGNPCEKEYYKIVYPAKVEVFDSEKQVGAPIALSSNSDSAGSFSASVAVVPEAPSTPDTSLSVENLYLLPLHVWRVWQSRFYIWLAGWVDRMNRKTRQLMAASIRQEAAATSSGAVGSASGVNGGDQDRTNLTAVSAGKCKEENTEERQEYTKDDDSFSDGEEDTGHRNQAGERTSGGLSPNSERIVLSSDLPADFRPMTVVEVSLSFVVPLSSTYCFQKLCLL